MVKQAGTRCMSHQRPISLGNSLSPASLEEVQITHKEQLQDKTFRCTATAQKWHKSIHHGWKLGHEGESTAAKEITQSLSNINSQKCPLMPPLDSNPPQARHPASPGAEPPTHHKITKSFSPLPCTALPTASSIQSLLHSSPAHPSWYYWVYSSRVGSTLDEVHIPWGSPPMKTWNRFTGTTMHLAAGGAGRDHWPQTNIFVTAVPEVSEAHTAVGKHWEACKQWHRAEH